jgi:hypothetical protein
VRRPSLRTPTVTTGTRWAVTLPGNLSAFGVGDTLAEALDDLGEGIRALFSAGPVPEELTREIAVTVDDAA